MSRKSRPALGKLLAMIASGVAVLLVATERARPDEAPALRHELLSGPVGATPQRMHRFRLRPAALEVDVIDLRFVTPVAGGLGAFTLAINGGYWEWHRGKRRSIGLVVSNGKQLTPLRKKLDGGVLVVQDGRARIARSQERLAIERIALAVQCRPRLVERGKPISELNSAGHAARTAVCTREGGRALDVYLSDPALRGPTLAELAGWLAAQGCEDALNLDGGPSTAAAFRDERRVLRIGAGEGLPYAIRFKPR